MKKFIAVLFFLPFCLFAEQGLGSPNNEKKDVEEELFSFDPDDETADGEMSDSDEDLFFSEGAVTLGEEDAEGEANPFN